MLSHDQLRDSYLNWLNEQITFTDLAGSIEITTPFLDRNNDQLQIYVIKNNDVLRLTDDSYTVTDLKLSGCDITKGTKRKQMFQTIINSYGVSFSSDTDEIYVDTTINNFPQKKHMLLQAMINVSDMFLTSKANVKNLFLDDVETYFNQMEISYTEHIHLKGKSGLSHKFDFILPRNKLNPERLICVINNPTLDKVKNTMFAWNDSKVLRKDDSKLITIINDSNKNVSPEIMTALQEYNIVAMPWSSKRPDILERVA